MKMFLKNEGIYYFTTQNSDTKANVVERVIKTIKNMMYRYSTKQRITGLWMYYKISWTVIMSHLTKV
jgi:hypothetical protein